MKISVVITDLLIFLLSISCVSAQIGSGALTIGDKFPNYTFHAYNAGSAFQFTLDAYKGKNVIIDLWDVHCIGCIYGIQKLDSLQKLFPDKLKIILVTKNSKEQVEELFSRKTIPRNELISVVGDTTLYDTFFPHAGDPLNVWIDETGIIKYITGGYNTTFDNLAKFFNKEPLNVAYQTKLNDFNSADPLIIEAASRLKFYTAAYSLFTSGLQNIVNTNRIEIQKDQSTGNSYSLKALNTSRLVLYQLAFNKELYGINLNMFQLHQNNRVILNSKRADSLEVPKEIENMDNWKTKNYFCYELYLPLKKDEDFFRWMQQDLQRFFNLKASIRLINTKCLILKNVNSNSENEPSKVVSMDLPNFHNSNLYNKREKMATSVAKVIYVTQDFNFPFVDGTDKNTNISIELSQKIKSIDELNTFLLKYGLLVEIGIHKTEFLVIE